ncbi:MAG: CHASE3 domain-containing protein, partial [Thermoanaerobaculia bacterium]
MLFILRIEQREEYRVVSESRPLVDAVREMDASLTAMVSSARGYDLTRNTAFQQQYDDAVRSFDTAFEEARRRAVDINDKKNV